jgi:hypothetical protein
MDYGPSTMDFQTPHRGPWTVNEPWSIVHGIASGYNGYIYERSARAPSTFYENVGRQNRTHVYGLWTIDYGLSKPHRGQSTVDSGLLHKLRQHLPVRHLTIILVIFRFYQTRFLRVPYARFYRAATFFICCYKRDFVAIEGACWRR